MDETGSNPDEAPPVRIRRAPRSWLAAETVEQVGSHETKRVHSVSIELLCKKLGMTQIFVESGEAVPVTVLEAGPNTVVQKKTAETDGYDAVQLGFGTRRETLFSKGEKGHFDKAGVDPTRYISESRLSADEVAQLEVGRELKVELFTAGTHVDAIGTSKGRGFTGVVKRHGFAIKKRTHGTHEFFRHGGSIGAGASPGKVIKGMGMAGQHGNARVTVRNLEVVRVDAERNLLFVRGAVPGHRNGLVKVRPSSGTSVSLAAPEPEAPAEEVAETAEE